MKLSIYKYTIKIYVIIYILINWKNNKNWNWNNILNVFFFDKFFNIKLKLINSKHKIFSF